MNTQKTQLLWLVALSSQSGRLSDEEENGFVTNELDVDNIK
jgi:hypothetical protein